MSDQDNKVSAYKDNMTSCATFAIHTQKFDLIQ